MEKVDGIDGWIRIFAGMKGRKSTIQFEQYDPLFTIKENADKLGCSYEALRKHIQRHKIDVQFDAQYQKWKTINYFKKENPTYSLRMKSRVLGYSIPTIMKYEALTKKELRSLYGDADKTSTFDKKSIGK